MVDIISVAVCKAAADDNKTVSTLLCISIKYWNGGVKLPIKERALIERNSYE